MRAHRRCRLGALGSLQFETPEFALWHVHELLRAEGWSPLRVERTLEDVVPWVPGPDELVATLMVDTVDAAWAQAVGTLLARPGGVVLRAGAEALFSDVVEAGTASDPVWYLRWRVTPRWRAALRTGALAADLAWDPQPVSLPEAMAAALRTDLAQSEGRSRSLLRSLLEPRLEPRKAHVQLQSPRHPSSP